ncbi:unannotated protein [freshwater metagenome]|uniref:Unannotated protein n=1 Tax=freshwater metagenome TaxID=449393 RepID=A0A6J5YIX3_9ZZZZ
MNRRKTERRRVLAEGDAVAALGGTTTDLGGGELGIPQRHHGERDEAAVTGAGAPFVDHPVVVDLNAQQGEFFVLALEEGLTAEAGKDVRETQRSLDMIGIHVGKALGLVVATDEDVVEGAWLVLHDLGAHGGRQAGERVDEVVVIPDIAVGPGRVIDGEGVATSDVHRHLVAFDARSPIDELLGQAGRPQIGRFHNVVVDRDDAGDVHGWLLGCALDLGCWVSGVLGFGDAENLTNRQFGTIMGRGVSRARTLPPGR